MTATRELFFYAPTKEAADGLAHALQTAGMLVPDAPRFVKADPTIDGDTDRYSLIAYAGYSGRYSPTADAELDAIHDKADELAAQHDAVCDGGGETIADLATIASPSEDTERNDTEVGVQPPQTVRELIYMLWLEANASTGNRIRALVLLLVTLVSVVAIVVTTVSAFGR